MLASTACTWLDLPVAVFVFSALQQSAAAVGVHEGAWETHEPRVYAFDTNSLVGPLQQSHLALAPHIRSLKDTSGSVPSVTRVTQPLQLQQAVVRGDTHILVEDHLDLAALGESIDGSSLLGNVPHTVKSIRGDCVAAPDFPGLNSPALQPRRPRQCLLLAHASVLEVGNCYAGDAGHDVEDCSGHLWLDNLYLRSHSLNFEDSSSWTLAPSWVNFVNVRQAAQLWMTAITMQGSGEVAEGRVRAVDVTHAASMYAQDCTFANIDTYDDGIVTVAGSAALIDCTFMGNPESATLCFLRGATAVLLWSPVLTNNSAERLFKMDSSFEPDFIVTGVDVEVWDAAGQGFVTINETTAVPVELQEQLLNDTHPWFVETREEAATAVRVDASALEPALAPSTPSTPSAGPPVELPELSPSPGALAPSNVDQTDDSAAPGSGASEDAAPSSDCTSPPCEDEPDSSTMIIGLCAGGAGLVAVLAVVGAAWKRRRSSSTSSRAAAGTSTKYKARDRESSTPYAVDRSAEAQAPPTPHTSYQSGYQPYEVPLSSRKASTASCEGAGSLNATATHTSAHSSNSPSARSSLRPSLPGASPSAVQNAPSAAAGQFMALPGEPPVMAVYNPLAEDATVGSTDTFAVTRLPDRAPPAGEAVSMEARLEYLDYQLTVSEGREVVEKLVLQPGMNARIQGGQAIIQFATDTRNGLPYAAKFFASRTAFEDEKALYMDSANPLGRFLPELRNIVDNDDGGMVDANGRALPPCIVMEKGESLDLWSRRNLDGMDKFTGMQVIYQIADSLNRMHSCGYVHRDLKPSNIMWLQRTNRWTLIDFGCAAKEGSEAPLSFSLAYAAPEIVRAVKQGARTILVDRAMDAWALGIVAVELFSDNTVLNVVEGKDTVMRRILGELPLPWEAELPESSDVLRSLGRLRADILGLLHRDPSQRMCVALFLKRLRSIFAQTTAQ